MHRGFVRGVVGGQGGRKLWQMTAASVPQHGASL